MSKRRHNTYRPELNQLAIPEKANRILNLILVAFILIIFRIWHLSVVQYDDKLAESRKPQRRVIVEPAKRGTIRDRYNIPLAINKLHYQATILYSQLKPIPVVAWETDAHGKKVKKFKRREYITKLSQLLAKELNLDADRIEDLIYSKASYYYQIPYVLKEDLTEKEYYRLKMLEKDWLGIQVQRMPKRDYPKGRVAADVIGYMGAINKQEYEKILHEMKALENYIRQHEAGEEPEPLQGIATLAQARRRLKDIQEHAYTINDYVGKAGIEGRFEQELRGYHGKKSFYSDARGNFLRELPGTREPLSGQRILLTLSSELQEYAEKLLAQNERIREARTSGVDAARQALLDLKQPWIKGGAIVAIDPNTGEIFTLASYPRFDPNDFIASANPEINKAKRSNVLHWLENEAHLAAIWDQKRPLERERYHDESEAFHDEKLWVNWETYLSLILPKKSPVADSLKKMGTIDHAIELQKNAERLIALTEQDNLYTIFHTLYPGEGHISHQAIHAAIKAKIEEAFRKHSNEVAQIKKKIDPWISPLSHTYDKVLCVDLCRLVVRGDAFDDLLIRKIGKQTIADYRDASASMATVSEALKAMAKESFHEWSFKVWRQVNEKDFLKQKRLKEKEENKYPKPYLDYLDAQEQEHFESFWKQYRWDLLYTFLTGTQTARASPELEPFLHYFATWYEELKQGAHPEVAWRQHYLQLKEGLKELGPEIGLLYLKTLRAYQDLERPLLGHYRHLRNGQQKQLEKHLATSFYPVQGYGYGRSQAYRQAATQGSIFKLVTAYTALIQRYQEVGGRNITYSLLNPLEIIDQTYKNGKDVCVGYTAEGKPIPQRYKGGRMLKSSHSNIGRVDLLRALETSSNPYFSLLAGDYFKDPEDLAEAAKTFCFGSCTGIDLPAEITGKVPKDLSYNRTGLYAMANGQHTLVVTPLQTSVMLSALANGGKVLKPKIVSLKAGKKPYRYRDEIASDPSFGYQESLKMVGIDFPLFSLPKEQDHDKLVHAFPTQVKYEIFMPDIVRNILLQGMKRVVQKQMREGLTSLSRFYKDYPEAISDYVDLKDQIVGKTSTAESMEYLDMDSEYGTNMYTHVWFGGVLFPKEQNYMAYDEYGNPELVVVVYLRYGHFGKEAAPLAAQMIQKWREIKEKYSAETR